MGCAGSKDVAAVDVYRPPPTSVSLFDVSAIEEPWLIATGKKDDETSDNEDDDEEEDEEEDDDDAKKPATTVVPIPLLEKLDGYDLAPASWSEVSKALEDIKPTLNSKATENTKPPLKKKTKKKKKQQQPQPPAQAHQAPPPPPVQTQPEPKKAPSVPATKAPPPTSFVRGANEEFDSKPPPPELTGRRVVKDNPFLMRDRENKGNDSVAAKWRRRDPFEGYPERRPPGASGGGVVLYTTTLRGVRRTFEDCERVRQQLETCTEAVAAANGGSGSAIAVDERDVSLHGEYLRELRELAGEGAAPPRLFVMGRYLGGAEACAELAESGKLRDMLRWARARGEACATKDGRGCEGCGGARFVPCWECGGSCKVVAGDAGDVERCSKCNENGLMMCPICH
ncbi:hypothetical protein GUJ93_ZPchr0008g11601 [Zizania palustris]|uniref:Glutaredoxin domain-containing protein n=1 Tax=Zizania palustris TaxID=103762 RepID=A0A8J5QX01_ZIZPA|nr:hypothetical protein GUJ93_ZPchr0008g11601 [Zizania palustris]